MFNLSDIVQQAQNGHGIENLAQQFGLTPDQAKAAVEALLPAVSAGLQQKTQEPGGLADIFGGVLNDRNQQAFDSAQALSDGAVAADGEDMLQRVFGSPQAPAQIAQYAAQTSGFSPSLLQSMLPMIVSMVMGGLFKGMQSNGLGGLLEQLARAGGASPGNSSGGLGDLLGQILGGSLGGGSPAPAPRQETPPQQQPSGGSGPLGGLLGGLLGSILGGGGQASPGGQGAPDGGAAQRPDQIFPGGLDGGSLQQGIDMLGKMLNPGGNTGGPDPRQGAEQQPGLQDLLGQILGGGRR